MLRKSTNHETLPKNPITGGHEPEQQQYIRVRFFHVTESNLSSTPIQQAASGGKQPPVEGLRAAGYAPGTETVNSLTGAAMH